mmetsp:Transcript_46347/g.112345  ORF Transcript_46347/g.112345 Transcript_46347/m.112345 type:complete len:272 (-) Transcript_46347:260-1075(-)
MVRGLDRSGQQRLMRTSLEGDVTLDVDIGTVDIDTVKAAVDIGSPVTVVPFDIQTVIGLQSGGQGAVVSQGALPSNRDVSTVVDGRSNAVVVIQLLADGDLLVLSRCCQFDVGLVHGVVKSDFLVVSRCFDTDNSVPHVVGGFDLLAVSRSCELDIGVAIVVRDDNIGFLTAHVVSWVDSDTSAIDIKSLGGLDAVDTEAITSGSDHANRKVSIFVVQVDLDTGVIAFLHVALGTGRDSPSGNVGAGLTPDIAWKGGNVRGWAGSSFDTVA